MKKIKITRTYEGFVDKCPYCKKRIQGSLESEVEYNMKKHIENKHKNEVKNGDNTNIRKKK